MRIGLFADKLARQAPTGVATYISSLSQALADHGNGHDYLLFSTRERSHVPRALYGLPTATLPGPRRAVQALWSLAGVPRVNGLHGRFDLLHVLVPSVPVPTTVPLVITINDLTPLQFPSFYSLSSRLLFRLSVRRAARAAAQIIAISERTRRDVIELLGVIPERVRTIHCGVTPGFGPQPEEEVERVRRRYGLPNSPFALFLGTITHRKNLLPLVDAFALAAPTVPECQLVLAGGMSLGHEQVVQRIQERGLTSRVLLPGYVDGKDLPALMSAASLFILPSAYEGFGLPALEAMACGTPVVVSDGGALPEVVGKAGIVVPGGEPNGLAAAICLVLTDEAVAARLVRLGYERASFFSWERAARETVAVYDEVLQAASGRQIYR